MANYTTTAADMQHPRPSNTGVTEISTFAHIDYLSITYPANTKLNELLPPEIKNDFRSDSKTLYGYRSAYRNTLGVLVLANGPDRQGVHVVAGGAALALIRAQGLTDSYLCEYVAKHSGQASRLDVAIDIFGGTLRPADMELAYKNGGLRTRARAGQRIYGVNTQAVSDTFYLGSRTSDKYLRFYAKEDIAPSKQTYMRLELELKKERARAMTTILAYNNRTRDVINQAIRDYIEWPTSKEFTDILQGDDINIPLRHRVETDWERWIRTQVVPSMVRQQLDFPERDILQYVVELYAQQISKQETYQDVSAS